MVFLTRAEHFNAAHKLYNPNWSEEENLRVFDKCANPNWHGHNYRLFITVKGEVNPNTGFVINAKELGKVIREKVIDVVDHRNLNLDVPFLKGKFTSAENVAIEIWNIMAPEVEKLGARLHCVKLQETDSISVEYFGN